MRMDPTQERALSRNLYDQVIELMDENDIRRTKQDDDLADEITGMLVDRWKLNRGLD